MDTVKTVSTHMDTIGQRLRAERERLGLSQPVFGPLVGVQKNAQINYESGKRSPDSDYLARAASIGVDVNYVLTGRRVDDPLAALHSAVTLEVRKLETAGSEFVERLETAADDEASSRQSLISWGEYVRVPLHDAWLSAGPGIENGDVAIIDHLVFRQEWLRKIDVKPEAAAMARISGDSMAPGIQSGDLVMIDTTRRDVPTHVKKRLPNQLPIFAFMQDNEARVKRLERRPREKILILYSDNKDIAPEVIAESDAHVLNILGQVVWSGHVWK